MSVPHPFVTETEQHVSLNKDEIAKAAVARAQRRGILISDASTLRSVVANTIDEAIVIQAGRRWARGEGATETIELGSLFGARPHVSEPAMDVATAAFRAASGQGDTMGGIRAVVFAVQQLNNGERERKRRARLLDFIDGCGDPYGRYTVRIGRDRVSHAFLTTEQLEDLAHRMCRDFWDDKRRNRENRAEIAARRAPALMAAE